MNCEKFLDRIQLTLDGDIELELTIEESEHLWQCDACAQTWQELQQIEDLALQATVEIKVDIPAGLHDGIMNVLQHEIKSKSAEKQTRRSRIPFLVPMSAAAVVMIAAGLAVYFDWQARNELSQSKMVISAPRIRFNAPLAATLLNPQQQMGDYLKELNEKAALLNLIPHDENENEKPTE